MTMMAGGVPTGVRAFVPAVDEDTTPNDGIDQTKAIPHIGKCRGPTPARPSAEVVESADDMARLMIVHSKYDGTNSVKVLCPCDWGRPDHHDLGSDGRTPN